MDSVYAVGANLTVGGRAPQLIFSLLVVGLLVAPGLTALVPIVSRGAHGLVLAGKSFFWKKKKKKGALGLIKLRNHYLKFL